MDLLTKKTKEIEMPDDMRERIIRNCSQIAESQNESKSILEDKMSRIRNTDTSNKKKNTGEARMRKVNNRWKKSLPMVAALVLCVCITGVTAMAAAGKLEGFFKDIKRWDKAVVGTSYEQATDEITVSIEEAEEELSVLVIIKEPDNIPYVYSEQFGINSYKIEDMSGKVIINESSYQERTTFNHQMSFNIPLNRIESGKYKLVIEQFVSEKKADQPLIINGNWECEFEF